MAESVIGLHAEELDGHLSLLEEYADELNTIAAEISALTFGSGGDNESAGPCAGKSNDLNAALNQVSLCMSQVVEKSVKHLKNIRDDIIAADEAQGDA